MTMIDATVLRLQQDNARQYVHNAIKSGELIKPTRCAWCGQEGKLEAHHADYANKLDVLFLCKSCHSLLHKGIKKTLADARKSARN